MVSVWESLWRRPRGWTSMCVPPAHRCRFLHAESGSRPAAGHTGRGVPGAYPKGRRAVRIPELPQGVGCLCPTPHGVVGRAVGPRGRGVGGASPVFPGVVAWAVSPGGFPLVRGVGGGLFLVWKAMLVFGELALEPPRGLFQLIVWGFRLAGGMPLPPLKQNGGECSIYGTSCS